MPEGPTNPPDDAPAPPAVLIVPLFPLPNVVLLPRAVLPLHIFEQRYRQMTADALAGDRQIAMALLRPGWEKQYHAHPAIEPAVCVGTILSHEQLPDGRYNLLLQGHTRATIASEDVDGAYRLAKLCPLVETPVLEIDLADERRSLARLFAGNAFGQTSIGAKFAQLLDGPAPTADLADLVAFNFIDDADVKQALLADGDVKRRVRTVVSALDAVLSSLPAARKRPSDPSLN